MKLNKEQIARLNNHKFKDTLHDVVYQIALAKLEELDQEFYNDLKSEYIKRYNDSTSF